MTIFTGAEARSFPLDLTACEREPIHLAGAIEPNGAMLVLGEQALTVLQASSNSLSQLNATPESLLGKNLADLFSPEDVIRLVSGSGDSGKHHYVRGLQTKNGLLLDALAHRYQGLLVIELEPSSPPASALAHPDIYTSLTLFPAVERVQQSKGAGFRGFAG